MALPICTRCGETLGHLTGDNLCGFCRQGYPLDESSPSWGELPERVAGYLTEYPGQRCEEIARGVHARTSEVRRILKMDERFIASKTWLDGVTAVLYQFTPGNQADGRGRAEKAKQLSRAARLYSVLRDGRVHSRQEIFERIGYELTNNAASELRKLGHIVHHSQIGRVHCYQLGEVEEGEVRGAGVSRPAIAGLSERPPSSTSSPGLAVTNPIERESAPVHPSQLSLDAAA